MSMTGETSRQIRMRVRVFSVHRRWCESRLLLTAASAPTVADGVNSSWTEPETVALVEVWAADDVQHSLKTCVHNSHIFAEIAEKMTSVGFPKTAEQCQSRMKRLKKTYRRYCNSRR